MPEPDIVEVLRVADSPVYHAAADEIELLRRRVEAQHRDLERCVQERNDAWSKLADVRAVLDRHPSAATSRPG